MKTIKYNKTRIFSIIASLLLVLSFVLPVSAQGNSVPAKAKLSEDLLKEFDANEETTFLVSFKAKSDVAQAASEAASKAKQANLSDEEVKVAKREAVVNALKTAAETTQEDVVAYLADNDNVSDYKSFYSSNVVSITATKEVAEKVASFNEVSSIIANPEAKLVEPVAKGDATLDASVVWNVDILNSTDLWDEGVMGEGVVIGNIDTGVQWDHVALKEKYRGYDAETDTVEHEGNFFDAVYGQEEAYDVAQHGTHTIGTHVGYSEEEDIYLGVAPEAKFISANIFDENESGDGESILAASDWMLAPAGDASKAPDVISNSWGFPGQDPEVLEDFFRPMLESWRAADILPVFAAMNEVPGVVEPVEGSIPAPGAYPEAFTVGAVDADKNLADFSLRGPSPYDEIKPDVSAGGVDVPSTVPEDQYVEMSGTSMATPAVAAVTALLIQNNPDASLEELEEAMRDTAEALTNDEYPESPNNGFGWGLVDVAAADEELGGSEEPEPEPEPKEVDRLKGDLRYDTAIEISQDGWEDGALEGEQVVVAQGDDFADALAGVPLAKAMDSPILLVPSGASDDNPYVVNVKEEMDRLGAESAVILGGSNAVSEDTEKKLNGENSLNDDKNRLSDDTRVGTAVEIADWLVDNGFATGEEAIVANGYNFPDALSVASPAAQNNLPILLTKAEELSEGTADALNGLGEKEVSVKSTYAIGGEKVVSENVLNALPETTVLKGSDRYRTNDAIIDEFGVESDHLYVATGEEYADALSGAVLAADNDSTVVLVQEKAPKALEKTLNTIEELNPEEITVFGGTVAVSDNIVDQLEDLLNN